MEDTNPATLSLLKSAPKFAQLMDGKSHLDLLRLGKRRFIEKHKYVFQTGDPVECVCLVEHGYLKIFQPTFDNKEMLLFFRTRGDILGLRGSLQTEQNSIRTYSAQACEDSEIFCIPVNEFRSHLEIHPRMALEVAVTLSRRMDDACNNFLNLSVVHVMARVARLIHSVGRSNGTHVGGGLDLDVPLTQQEIANMVGASRQTVSGVLSALKHEGVLSESHKYLRIEDEERLKMLSVCNNQIKLEK